MALRPRAVARVRLPICAGINADNYTHCPPSTLKMSTIIDAILRRAALLWIITLAMSFAGSQLSPPCSYYYANVWLGSPPQQFALIVDTGSTVTYVPCATCSQCGKHQVRRREERREERRGEERRGEEMGCDAMRADEGGERAWRWEWTAFRIRQRSAQHSLAAMQTNSHEFTHRIPSCVH